MYSGLFWTKKTVKMSSLYVEVAVVAVVDFV